MASKDDNTELPGTSVVIKLRRPDPAKKEVADTLRDAFFPTFGSVLVWDARNIIDGLLEDYQKQLSIYNQKLKKYRIPLRIRIKHSTEEKGRKYIYCGRYLYTDKGKYVGKIDNAVLRNDYIREKWNIVGPPPRNVLDGFKYSVVVTRAGEQQHVVIPYNIFHDERFHHLFDKLTAMRLG